MAKQVNRVMRRLLTILLFLFGTVLVPAHAAEADRIPPLSLLTEVRLGVYPGWSLSILPNGSAAIGYGSHAPDFASVLGKARIDELWEGQPPSLNPR